MSSDTVIQTSSARFMHSLPRFGHGSEFSKLASSEPSEQADYVMGLLAISFFILSLFIMGAAIIIFLRCMGNQRTGYLSGRVRVKSDEKGRFQPPSYLWKLRCFFMLLGCSMILCTLALVGPGMRSIQSTTFSARKLNREISDILTQGILIIDSVARAQTNIEKLDIDMLLQVEDACPVFGNNTNNTFVSDKTMSTSLSKIEQEFEGLKDYLEGDTNFVEIGDQIREIMEGSEYLDKAATFVEKNDWVVRMFALILGGIIFFMLLSSFCSLCGKTPPALKFMDMFLILPVFVILIVGSWLTTSFLAVVAISNADICVGGYEPGSPEQTVQNIFQERGMSEDSMVSKAFSYYQSGCTTPDPIEHLYKYEDHIQGGIGSAHKFLAQSEEIGVAEITDQCGANAMPMIEGIGLVKDNLGILLGALRSTFEIASCSKISPIYRRAFNGAACTDSVEGLTLLFWIMFAISIIGMLMILLRSAMFPYKKVYLLSEEIVDDDDEWEEYQAYLKYMADFFNIWGDEGDNDALDIKMKDTGETASSETTSNTDNFLQALGHSYSDEERPLSPPKNLSPDGSYRFDHSYLNEERAISPHNKTVASYHSAQKLEHLFEDEEQMPLSPDQHHLINSIIHTTNHSFQYTPQASQMSHDDDDDDELQPLTPHTPNIEVRRTPIAIMNEKSPNINTNGRLKTPGFLSPGTFRRWRRHDDDDISEIDNLASEHPPLTPLISSPRENGELSSFPRSMNMSNYLSPVISRQRSGVPNSEDSTKNKIV